jgi:hypothetical protein
MKIFATRLCLDSRRSEKQFDWKSGHYQPKLRRQLRALQVSSRFLFTGGVKRRFSLFHTLSLDCNNIGFKGLTPKSVSCASFGFTAVGFSFRTTFKNPYDSSFELEPVLIEDNVQFAHIMKSHQNGKKACRFFTAHSRVMACHRHRCSNSSKTFDEICFKHSLFPA